MTQPAAYAPTTSFDPFNPSSFPNFGRKVDVEFANIATTTNEIRTNLALLQRDDGALANDSVGPDQLENSVFAGINTPAAWVTATAYVVRDSVYFIVTGSSGYTKWYKCIVAHTSGVFATDLAAGYWELVLEADAGPTGPAGAGTASDVTPAAIVIGAGTVGVTTAFSRDDHVHPLTAATAAQGAALSSSSLLTTPSSLAFLLQVIGKRTDVSGSASSTAFTRERVTASVTRTLPTLAANEWVIYERDTTAGSVTIGRNSQTIDGASADFVMDRNKDIILFFCDSAGVVVTRFMGVVPT